MTALIVIAARGPLVRGVWCGVATVSRRSLPTVDQGGGVASDWYASVHFEAGGRTAQARVMLSPCGLTCSSLYRTGQDLTVFYDPENLGYAQLHPANRSGYVWVVFLGLMGVIFLTGAVVNMVPQIRRIIGPRSGLRR